MFLGPDVCAMLQINSNPDRFFSKQIAFPIDRSLETGGLKDYIMLTGGPIDRSLLTNSSIDRV